MNEVHGYMENQEKVLNLPIEWAFLHVFKNDVFYFLCVMYVCVRAPCACVVPLNVRKGHQIFWNQNYG